MMLIMSISYPTGGCCKNVYRNLSSAYISDSILGKLITFLRKKQRLLRSRYDINIILLSQGFAIATYVNVEFVKFYNKFYILLYASDHTY